MMTRLASPSRSSRSCLVLGPFSNALRIHENISGRFGVFYTQISTEAWKRKPIGCYITNLYPPIDLIPHPVPIPTQLRIKSRRSLKQRQHPGQMREYPNHLQEPMDLLQDIRILPLNQHVERFSKRKIPHDIKTVVIEPPRNIHGLFNPPVNGLD